MRYFRLAYAITAARGQRRKKAVKHALQKEVFQERGPKDPEIAAHIMNKARLEGRPEAVGDGRSGALQPRVPAVFAPATNDVIAFGGLRQQGGNVLGGVLAVTVQRDDPISARRVEAGLKRRRKAAAPLKAHQDRGVAARADLGEPGEGAVGRGVVHPDDLVGQAEVFHDALDALL